MGKFQLIPNVPDQIRDLSPQSLHVLAFAIDARHQLLLLRQQRPRLPQEAGDVFGGRHRQSLAPGRDPFGLAIDERLSDTEEIGLAAEAGQGLLVGIEPVVGAIAMFSAWKKWRT